uniref:Uncharacterized protein n=1 Tax=Cacopsylla melanoneura TaxID=428564 RepID=A0A8D8SGX9_9HEMI
MTFFTPCFCTIGPTMIVVCIFLSQLAFILYALFYRGALFRFVTKYYLVSIFLNIYIFCSFLLTFGTCESLSLTVLLTEAEIIEQFLSPIEIILRRSYPSIKGYLKLLFNQLSVVSWYFTYFEIPPAILKKGILNSAQTMSKVSLLYLRNLLHLRYWFSIYDLRPTWNNKERKKL